MRSAAHEIAAMQNRGAFQKFFIDKFRAFLPFHLAWALSLTAGLLYWIPAAQNSPATIGIGLTLIAVVSAIGVRLANLRYVENQMFGFAVIGACWFWLMVVYFFAPGFKTSGIMLGVLVAGFGLFYAFDRRNNVKINVNEQTRSWKMDQNRQERAKVKTTEWLEFNDTEYGWEGVLGWQGSSNMVEEVIQNRKRLEAEWGERRDTLSIQEAFDPQGRAFTDRVICRCVQTNPLTNTILWDGVVADSITSSKKVATYADAQYAEKSMWEPGIGGEHMLFAGASRSGKSVAMKHQIVTWGAPKDGSAIITLSDLKGGSSFLKFAPMSAWTVTSVEGALQQLEALAIIVNARAAYIASRGDWGEAWEPGPGFPVILAFFDEVAELLDKDVPAEVRSRAIPAMKTIARMGMGCGVLLRLGVQEPTKEAVGSMQILTQLVYRVAFRLQYYDRAQYCVQALAKNGVEPARIPRNQKGVCYIEDGILNRTERARWIGITSKQENKVIRDRWLATAQFAECDFAMVNGESARPLLEARTIYTIDDIPPGSDEDEGDAVEIGGYAFAPPTRRLGSGTRGEALPVTDDAADDDEDAPAALPAGPTRRVSDAGADASPRDMVEIDAEGINIASVGRSKHMRLTMAEALQNARPEPMLVQDLRDACQREHGGQPSRTWANDTLKEWREMDPPLVRHLGNRKGYLWVYGETPEVEPTAADRNDRVLDPAPTEGFEPPGGYLGERPVLRLVREEDE